MTSDECQITKKSNHDPIHLNFSAIGQNNIKICLVKSGVYNLCSEDYDNLMRLISTNPFNSYCCSNLSCIVENWYFWLNVFLNETIPKRTQHPASLPSWISQKPEYISSNQMS